MSGGTAGLSWDSNQKNDAGLMVMFFICVCSVPGLNLALLIEVSCSLSKQMSG
jgi:hypothetical protein